MRDSNIGKAEILIRKSRVLQEDLETQRLHQKDVASTYQDMKSVRQELTSSLRLSVVKTTDPDTVLGLASEYVDSMMRANASLQTAEDILRNLAKTITKLENSLRDLVSELESLEVD